jgi:hypothetical protein
MARTIIRAAAPISVNATRARREFDLTDSRSLLGLAVTFYACRKDPCPIY